MRSAGSLDGSTISGGKFTLMPSVPLPSRSSQAANARKGEASLPCWSNHSTRKLMDKWWIFQLQGRHMVERNNVASRMLFRVPRLTTGKVCRISPANNIVVPENTHQYEIRKERQFSADKTIL